ncbi:hypothetical protein B0H17DRAFT_1089062 [Mycena rosella]|uniref:Uncharacterized protein n=1 Tax=Mycena rosella TaxID=1033263 RepID=A0AAD7G8F6_MYCRO|nr:hypothetical protein B0H17DRAFT_1089062 [Mycena rosella]
MTASTSKLPHASPRLLAIGLYGSLTLVVLWFILSRESWGQRRDEPSSVIDAAAMEALGLPMFHDIRQYEHDLPQHTANESNPRYLFFPGETWGAGLVNTHLAYLSDRAYVFVDYIARDHPPFPDKLAGVRHWLHVPANAFMSGPTAGGHCPRRVIMTAPGGAPSRRHGGTPPAPRARRNSQTRRHALQPRARRLERRSSNHGQAEFFYTERPLDLWPTYSASPALQLFSWSPLIAGAIARNFALLSPARPPPYLAPAPTPAGAVQFAPYRPAHPPLAGLLGLHVRRGDFKKHCVALANDGASYEAWNRLSSPGVRAWLANETGDVYPDLPDALEAGEGSHKEKVLAHCWPSQQDIVRRVRAVREAAVTGDNFAPQALRTVYIATDSERRSVDELTALLKADGWEAVSSTLDMTLTLEERAVAQAVDMAVLTGAETFIGVGFSSLTSNVAQIRLASGRHPHTIRFW